MASHPAGSRSAGLGSARYDFAVTWPDGFRPTVAAQHLHTGSVAALMAPGEAERLLRARGPGTTASYDPNIRPSPVGEPEDCRRHVSRIVAAGEVVKASDEDLAWPYPGVPPLVRSWAAVEMRDVARRWLALGPARPW